MPRPKLVKSDDTRSTVSGAKVKRAKCNSTHSQAKLRAMLADNVTVESPLELNQAEQKSFNEIITCFPIDSWDHYRARMAAQLARAVVQSDEIFEDTKHIPFWYESNNGDYKEHPSFGVYMKSLLIIQNMSKTLGLAATARRISKADMSARLDQERDGQKSLSKTASGFLA